MTAQTKAQRLQSQGGEQGRGEGGGEGGAARVVTRVPLPRFQSPFASAAVEAAVGSSKETWQSKVDPGTGRVYYQNSGVDAQVVWAAEAGGFGGRWQHYYDQGTGAVFWSNLESI